MIIVINRISTGSVDAQEIKGKNMILELLCLNTFCLCLKFYCKLLFFSCHLPRQAVSHDHRHFNLLASKGEKIGKFSNYSPSCQTNMENQLFQYCTTRKDNTGSVTFRNWNFCLYNDSSRDTRWNTAWALGKSFRLRLLDFPRAQDIFHRISHLLS